MQRSISNNSGSHSYFNENGQINIMGNLNKIKLNNCTGNINLMGNGNEIMLVKCTEKILINGNGNNISVAMGQLMIGINGNANEISVVNQFGSDKSQITVSHVNGSHNVIPNNAKKQQKETNTINNNTSRNMRTNYRLNKQGRVFDLRRRNQIEQEENEDQVEGIHQTGRYQTSNAFQARQNQLLHPRIPNNYQNFNNPIDINQQNSLRSRNVIGFQGIRNHSYRNNSNIPSQIPHYNTGVSQPRVVRRIDNSFNHIRQQQNVSGLDQSQLNKLPSSFLQSNGNNCTICLEQILKNQSITYLFCFHCFHTSCARDWLKKSATCPVCQLNMKEWMEKQL